MSPHRARWRRWAAASARHRATYGRWLPLLPREPCWERAPARAVPPDGLDMDEGDIVRAYVTAYTCEECAA
ncbi:hypothetical protein [Streptomyces adelaidensis]|uniref:hypothetical protein n=1 Tax=Streptomyces adelaidensis TaxID=2796465 RepID=UPI00190750C8|nr:hypothetical protein [Streptomyces adelaidensis]